MPMPAFQSYRLDMFMSWTQTDILYSLYHPRCCITDFFTEQVCTVIVSKATPKTNMECRNEGLEDDFPFQRSDFQIPCSVLVFGEIRE